MGLRQKANLKYLLPLKYINYNDDDEGEEGRRRTLSNKNMTSIMNTSPSRQNTAKALLTMWPDGDDFCITVMSVMMMTL